MPNKVERTILEKALYVEDDIVIAFPGEPVVNIDAVTARRKVSGYIGLEISTMMGGTEAALVWRVPVLLTSPFRGRLGVVGSVDVDARTSELLIPANLADKLHENARVLLDENPKR